MRRPGAKTGSDSSTSSGSAIVHELEYQGAGLRVLEPEFRTLSGGAGRLMVTVLRMVAAMARRHLDRQDESRLQRSRIGRGRGNGRKMHDDGKGLRRSLRPCCVEDECAPHIKGVRGEPTRPCMDLIFFAALPDMDLTFFTALPDNGGHD
jgi:hypothetical protein